MYVHDWWYVCLSVNVGHVLDSAYEIVACAVCFTFFEQVFLFSEYGFILILAFMLDMYQSKMKKIFMTIE